MGKFSLKELTEQIAERHKQNEVEKLVSKWRRTGLLKNIPSMTEWGSMAKIVPSEGAELLREKLDNKKNCPECGGTGFYVGLTVREACKTCGGLDSA